MEQVLVSKTAGGRMLVLDTVSVEEKVLVYLMKELKFAFRSVGGDMPELASVFAKEPSAMSLVMGLVPVSKIAGGKCTSGTGLG